MVRKISAHIFTFIPLNDSSVCKNVQVRSNKWESTVIINHRAACVRLYRSVGYPVRSKGWVSQNHVVNSILHLKFSTWWLELVYWKMLTDIVHNWQIETVFTATFASNYQTLTAAIVYDFVIYDFCLSANFQPPFCQPIIRFECLFLLDLYLLCL